ncbi:MAG TPA: ThiF family adenylyltransferase, partial [Corynebacterium sp.]|nr:ThiF family adenylyltransferase [Corynebacterium sp.]
VGRVTIIDDDVVELSNLHRQVIHTVERIGTSKAESAAAAMVALNPEIQVDVVTKRLTWENAREILAGAEVILDGADNFDTRHLASTAAARLGVPHVWAAILGFEAQLSVFWAGHGPVYEDLFPTPPAPGQVPSCSQAGVLGPVVGVVGAAMALEAIKVLTGVGEPLVGELGYYDSGTGRWEYVPLAADPATAERLRTHGPARQAPALPFSTPDVPEVEEIPAGAVLIDVREPAEVANFTVPGALNVPLGEILSGHTPTELSTAGERPVVFYCAAGVRSARAVAALGERGVTGLWSLRGGIDRWLDQQV